MEDESHKKKYGLLMGKINMSFVLYGVWKGGKSLGVHFESGKGNPQDKKWEKYFSGWKCKGRTTVKSRIMCRQAKSRATSSPFPRNMRRRKTQSDGGV